MNDELFPYFSQDTSNGTQESKSSDSSTDTQDHDTNGSNKRPLTPAPSVSKSYESPAPMIVSNTSRTSIAIALFWGMVFGSFIVGSIWFYQNRHTYFYKVQNNTSVLTKPRDIQELLAHIEPATVAVTVGPGVSAGTGFIYSQDGLIVTNNHVIEESKNNIEVTLGDGRTFEAKLLGRDPLEDLAVLKIEGTKFPVATLGSSAKMKVGDDVIAIGNALALDGGLSVTRGIVSGLDRTIDTELGFELQGIIQTDAAINRGNSGGPLVNSRGEVIGINTAIANPSFAQNIGFAIPIDRARPIIEDLKKGKDRKIAFLGVAAQDVTERLVRELGLKVNEGAIVVEIKNGSPAAGSSLTLGDVIIKIDSKKITSSSDMVEAIRSKKPGETVTIIINRKGAEKSLKVKLVERPL